MKEDEDPKWSYRAASDVDLSGMPRLQSERRELGLIGATWHGITRLLTKCLLAALIRVKVEDRHHLPEDGPFVLVANHTSHLDALLLASLLPARFTGRVYSIAAADYFFDTPSKTIFSTRWVNALPLRRGGASAKALATLRERLTVGDEVFVVFPEGTRSRSGKLQDFRPGIGMLVAGTTVPVVPCHIEGAFDIWPADSRLPRPGTVTLRLGEPMHFGETEHARGGWKTIAERLRASVAAHVERPTSS